MYRFESSPGSSSRYAPALGAAAGSAIGSPSSSLQRARLARPQYPSPTAAAAMPSSASAATATTSSSGYFPSGPVFGGAGTYLQAHSTLSQQQHYGDYPMGGMPPVSSAAAAATANTGGAASSQDRYVRLLERDVETLRAELRVAREKAENPELLRELREAQEVARSEQRRCQEMERQLQLAAEAERARAASDAAVDGLRDECRQQQLALSQMERDLSQAQDAVRTLEHREATMQEQLQRARDDLQAEQMHNLELQQAHTAQVRQLQHERESAALEHSRALNQLQLEQGTARNELRMREQELRAREQTIESLSARLKKEAERATEVQASHEKTVAELRASKADLEKSLRAVMQESSGRANQLSMKDELVALLQEETKHKQARLDEGEKAFAAIKAELLAAQERITDLTGHEQELEHKIAELDSQLKTTETLRKEAEARDSRARELYTELGQILGASEAQCHASTVAVRAKEVLAEMDRLHAELRDLQREHDVAAHESSSRNQRVEQLQRELEKANAEAKRQSGEMTSLREDLLARTRELKELTLAHEQLHRELRSAEERGLRFDEVVAQKDRYIEDLNRQIERLNMHGVDQADELRDTLTRAESEYQKEAARLRADMARLQEEHRADRQYAELCRRLSRLLRVETDTTATVHAEKLHAAVEHLLEKSRENERLAAQLQMQPAVRPPWPADNAVYPPYDPKYHSPLASLSQAPPSHSLNLRKEVQDKEEELLTLRVQHESFVREVGRLVHAENIHNYDHVLQGLKNFARKHASCTASRHAGSSTTAKEERSTLGSKKSTEPHHDEADYQKLKKRLTTALKTIESQDMWIDVLNRKIESLGGAAHGSTGEAAMQQEMRRMEEQVNHLKMQLSLKDSSFNGGRPGSAMPLYVPPSTTAGLGAADILAFKSTIADLELRLQKHIEFRDKVLEVLGLKIISASDEEILRHIKQAVQAAQGTLNGSSTSPAHHAFGSAGPSPSVSSAARRSPHPPPARSTLGYGTGSSGLGGSASLGAPTLTSSSLNTTNWLNPSANSTAYQRPGTVYKPVTAGHGADSGSLSRTGSASRVYVRK